MKKIISVIVSVWLSMALAGSSACAMDGVFDRTAEVEKFMQVMKTGTEGDVVVAAKAIYASGISDRRLADAVNERMLADYAELAPPRRRGLPGPLRVVLNRTTRTVDENYGVWLVKALQSFGFDDYLATLDRVSAHPDRGGSKVPRMRTAAANAPKYLPRHRSINVVMASRKNHNEGDDPQASMVINLLLSDESSHREFPSHVEFALDRIHDDRMFDPRILSLLDRQLLEYIEKTAGTKADDKNMIIAKRIKVLGLAGDRQYRGTIEKLLASKANRAHKRHAEVALSQLQ